MNNSLRQFVLLTTLLFCCFVFAFKASASATNGTIDSTNKYAWGENLGWINFAPSNGGLNITDTAITGYAWEPIFWLD